MNELTDIIIAVDAMGGDNAPDEIVKGAAQATLESPVKIILIGDETRIHGILSKTEYIPDKIEIVSTDVCITSEDVPRTAISKKRDASMVMASKLCGEGKAHCMVSAGNTGAYILSALKYIPRILGVRKPAIATIYPTMNAQKRKDNFAMLLDVGANNYCSAENMVQFALMGKIYTSIIKGIAEPTVALLNIGKEPYKGGEMLSAVHESLSKLPNVNFIGNIEGNDVLKGLADVVVTEGYVGNIVMKTIEGMAETLSHLGKYAFKRRLMWMLGLIALSGGIRELKKVTDYSVYGGAPLVGFQKIVIKAHGRSKAKAITNAIKMAAKTYMENFCDKIAEEIAQFESYKYLETVG